MAEYMDISDDIDVNENQPIERVIRGRSNPFEEFNDSTFKIGFAYQRAPFG